MNDPAAPQTGSIFISYSRADRDAAIAIRSFLEQAGLSVFHDVEAIHAGDEWMTRLQDALQGCSAFVVLVGREGVRRWIGAEVQVAINRHIAPRDEAERLPIFPVLLEGSQPEMLPPFLALFQATRWSAAEPLPAELIKDIRRRSSRLFAGKPFEGCPFLGLSAFQPKDARLFFGRRQETLDALACLGSQRGTNPERLRGGGGANYYRWLQIEGNSGSGKSSLVNAGMLPMIERGALWARTGFDHWRIVGPMLPGRNPLEKLAEVLERCVVPEEGNRNSLARLQRLGQDERALAFALRDVRQDDTAFLLVLDQFEELFTLADPESRKLFDAQLACALQDPECPLFVITTVRADFLDRFEQLPRLQAIYNSRCKRFFLPTISEQGLREAIEQPARLAGLDVREVVAAMLEDARDEVGALPLVENALYALWDKREGNRLSGEQYRLMNGIAGMLSNQADDLLKRVDAEVPKGKQAALEVLLRLTRINDEGRHTRQRITREEAVFVAGDGDDEKGERIVRYLSGERAPVGPSPGHDGALRLITILATRNAAPANTNEREADLLENGEQYVDLIHETLIRARVPKAKGGVRVAYWPTLYDYIEKNRDRDLRRQQLKLQAEQWQGSRGLGRWWSLAGWRDLRRYWGLHTPKRSPEGRFLAWSQVAAWVRFGVWGFIVLLVGIFGESYVWVTTQQFPQLTQKERQQIPKLPLIYTFFRPFWMLGYTPEPEMVDIPQGTFKMGCAAGRDDIEGKCPKDELHPDDLTMIAKPFGMGKYEVTFRQYDAYVFYMRRHGHEEIAYPDDRGWGRDDRPVINVTWRQARDYAQWLRHRTGKPYRLPSEKEWEYAARAGTSTAYWWGKDSDPTRANCRTGSSDRRTLPVGSFGKLGENPWGVHDTAGNVGEWVEDAYDKYEKESVAGKAVVGEADVARVVRGGSFYIDPQYCRAADRNFLGPDKRGVGIGFRVCYSSPIE